MSNKSHFFSPLLLGCKLARHVVTLLGRGADSRIGSYGLDYDLKCAVVFLSRLLILDINVIY